MCAPCPELPSILNTTDLISLTKMSTLINIPCSQNSFLGSGRRFIGSGSNAAENSDPYLAWEKKPGFSKKIYTFLFNKRCKRKNFKKYIIFLLWIQILKISKYKTFFFIYVSNGLDYSYRLLIPTFIIEHLLIKK